VSAVNANVVWASGSKGTYLHSSNGGTTWEVGQVPNAAGLDFRGIRAVDAQTVYLMSSGPGGKSQIFKTTDAGKKWIHQFTNPDAKGFFDGVAFWDARHGIVVGDPVDGAFVVFTTEDGGAHWIRKPGPPAVGEEGAFAASNTSIALRGKREAWVGSGGIGGARVFHTRDGGSTWSAAATGMRNDSASAGIFSVAFRDGKFGMAVGGDYAKDKEATLNRARTVSGGRAWEAGSGPKGFRSAVAFLAREKMWIATGTSGSDVTRDDGRTWTTFDSGAYNAMSFAGGLGWAVGPAGRVARFRAR
jgi:photosystem II stability/assembly factor-like uncharacterized protein